MTGGSNGAARRWLANDWIRVLILAATLFVAYWILWHFAYYAGHLAPGGDFRLYEAATRRWLAGGSFYQPYQLAGPYDPMNQLGYDSAILYPPSTLVLLLVPATFVPMALWFAIPIGVTAGIVIAWRPSLLAWLAIVALLRVDGSLATIWYGNPGIWLPMAIAVALRYRRGAAALVLLKPSLFPFALIGVRDRRWWLVAALFAAVSLLLLPLTLDWLRVVLNAQGERAGLFYSLREAPLCLVPLAAWAGRRRAQAPLRLRNADEHRVVDTGPAGARVRNGEVARVP